MKHLIAFLLLFSSLGSYQQDIQFGIDISPAWNLNAHKSKTTTAWSAENGYGFNLGFAVKYWMNKDFALNSGLNYEYVSFDSWAFNTLQTSLRFNSVNVPILFSKKLVGDWYGTFGGGANFILMSRNVVLGSRIDISPSIDEFQPYLAIGATSLVERDAGIFEFGFLARYHFMELWDENYPPVVAFSSHIIALDVIMRFYF